MRRYEGLDDLTTRGLYNIQDALHLLDTSQIYRGYFSSTRTQWTGVDLKYDFRGKAWKISYLIAQIPDLGARGAVPSLDLALLLPWVPSTESQLWTELSLEELLRGKELVFVVRLDLPPITEEMYF